MSYLKLRAILSKSNLKIKLILLLCLLVASCALGLLSFLTQFGLPIVPAFIVPGGRQLVVTSSHPLVRFFSEPQIAAVTPDGCDIDPKVYVTNLRSNSVSVIDVGTDEVIATVPVGRNPFAITITPDCSKAYVGNSGNLFIPENTVSVINVRTDTLIDTDPNKPGINPIKVGFNPGAMAMTPDGSKLYVANFGTENVPDNTVSVIDVETDTVIDVDPSTPEVLDPITVDLRPGALVITSDGSRVYVTHAFGSTISVIDVETDTVIDKIINAIIVDGEQIFQFNPAGIAIAGSRAYVANADSDTVSVIDLSENDVIAAIAVGTKPLVVVATPDGSKIYVTNLLSNNVSVIDVQKSAEDPDDAVIATIPVGVIPIGIGITPNGSKAYVGNCNCGTADPLDPDTVSVIDVVNDTLIDVDPGTPGINSIEVGFGPLGLAVTPDGSKVYVPNSNSSTVSVIDTSIDEVTETVPVGSGPAEVAITPDDTTVYVSNFNNPDSPGNTVSIINAATNTVIGEVTVGLGPAGMAITPDGSKLYVVNFGSIREPGDTVSVIDVQNSLDMDPGNDIITTVNLECVIGAEEVPCGPLDVAISPNGSEAYITNFGGRTPLGDIVLGSTVSVIDIQTDTLIDTDLNTPGVNPIPVGDGPAGIAVKPNPDASKVYVANLGGLGVPGNTVSVIDLITGTISAIPVGLGPIDVAITPDGSEAYVSNFGSIASQTDFEAGNSVSVIDLMTNDVFAKIPIGSGAERIGPAGVAIAPEDGSKIYVSNLDVVSKEFGLSGVVSISDPGDTVSVINRGENNVDEMINVGNRPFGVAVTSDGSTIYVANYFGNTVSVIDVTTNTVVRTIEIK